MFNAACLAVSCVPSLAFSHEVGARQTPGKLTVCQDRRLFWGLTPESSALSESSRCPSPGMGGAAEKLVREALPRPVPRGTMPATSHPAHCPSTGQASCRPTMSKCVAQSTPFKEAQISEYDPCHLDIKGCCPLSPCLLSQKGPSPRTKPPLLRGPEKTQLSNSVLETLISPIWALGSSL